MAGSLRPIPGKSGLWELRVYLGRDASGRVRHRHARFHGSRREAERELARMVAEQTVQPLSPPNEPRLWGPATTVNDAIAAWRHNGWQDLSPRTAEHYEAVWRLHIAGTIGRRKIASLGPYDVERFYRGLKERGLSQATVRQVKAVLHRACRLARKWSAGALPNPAADADLPVWRLEEQPEPVRAPTPAEVRTLIAAAEAEDVRIATFVQVLAATGMRRGEACALRWNDVDLAQDALTVDESVIGARGGVAVKGPKTRASVRRVACDERTMGALEALRTEQERLAGSCNTVLRPDSFVFSFEPDGSTPPYPTSFSHAIVKLRRRAGLAEDIHLHSLRHFHATMLDAVVSEAQKQSRLGWSTVQMARHYTDAVPAEDRKAAEHIASLLA